VLVEPSDCTLADVESVVAAVGEYRTGPDAQRPDPELLREAADATSDLEQSGVGAEAVMAEQHDLSPRTSAHTAADRMQRAIRRWQVDVPIGQRLTPAILPWTFRSSGVGL
jgi:hypothetical protein